MKKQISRISVHQTAKVFAFIYFLISLVILVPIGIGAIVTKHEGGFMFFLLPFIYLLIGYLSWLLLGFFYNLVAKHFGGIEFDLTDTE